MHRNKGKVSKYFSSNIQFDIYTKPIYFLKNYTLFFFFLALVYLSNFL